MLPFLKDLWRDLRRSFQKDPTADWPAAAAVPLVFDLARRELNGVPLGGSYALLRRFGRPGNPQPFLRRQLGFPPCSIELRLPAFVRVQVTPQTTRADLKQLLGDRQEETGVLGYRYPGVYLGFEFDREDQLRVLDLEAAIPASSDRAGG